MIKNLQELIDLYADVYYVENTDLIPLVCAVAISCRLEGDPIWLWLVGGSSSGKSTIIDAIGDVRWVKKVSMLTTNTFLSGMVVKSKDPEDSPSLLIRMGRAGVLTFSDWTSMLSTHNEKQAEISGQLREIFDGKLYKETGNGTKMAWEGKACIIAGCTEAIHMDKNKTNEFGTRQLMYTLPITDRKRTTKRAMQNAKRIKSLRQTLRDGFKEYIEGLEDKIPLYNRCEISPELEDEITNLADLTSIATTGVARNYRGELELMLSAALPMRYAEQVANLGRIFMMMNGGEMPDWGKRIMFKCLIDSIPKQRLLCLRVLAKYREVTTKGVGILLGYETDLVSRWLADLDALKICKRVISTESAKTRWVIHKEYREVMLKYDNIQYVDELYAGTEVDQNVSKIREDDGFESSEREEQKKEVMELWNGM